jgi:hypothetical protein
MNEYNWSNFKTLVDLKSASIQWVIDSSGLNYHLFLFDGSFSAMCILPIGVDNVDTTDFEDNYKDNGNKPLKSTVLTEPANISLTHYMASDVVTVTAGNEETIDIEIEQVNSETQQILYGGALHAQDYDFSDYVKFQIVDVNNILGYGAGVVLKQYITKAYLNNQGTFEDYDEAGAYLPVGLFLRCIYKSEKASGTTKVKINYLLGIV